MIISTARWFLTGMGLTAAMLPTGFADTASKNILNAVAPPPSAETLLAQVRAGLPKEKLLIKGKLMKGERIGRLKQAFLMEVLLEWGQPSPSASYTLSDAFGTPRARLTVVRPPGHVPEFRYEQGQPLAPAPTPDLNQPIEGTELTWNDLSLSFLWATNGVVAGRDNIRGRDCTVIEVPARASPGPACARPGPVPVQPGPRSSAPHDPPAGARPSPTAGPNAPASMRLWIDDHLVVLIQMEEYDAEGTRLRRLSVKNFKKIAEVWMIKNMDIRRYPSGHRTQIRIDDVITGAASNAPEMNLGE